MDIFTRVIAEIKTGIEAKDYAKNKKSIRALMLAMDLEFKEATDESYAPHPSYQSHLEKCKKDFLNYIASDYQSDTKRLLGIGDSILAQSRDDVKSVLDKRLNYSLGGMRACHMLQLLKDLDSTMKKYKFVPNSILVGTPGGNNLLQHQKIEVVISEVNALLNYIRKRFPTTKIVLYSIPLTIVDYVIANYTAYTQNMVSWMIKDGNAVMIPFIKNFVAAWHIFMKADYSADGVHLSPIGRAYFCDLIKRSLKGRPGQFIN
jgi:hypothetical protein